MHIISFVYFVIVYQRQWNQLQRARQHGTTLPRLSTQH